MKFLPYVICICIVVPKLPARDQIIAEYNENNSGVMFSWPPAEGSTGNLSYTIFWCKGKLNSHRCEVRRYFMLYIYTVVPVLRAHPKGRPKSGI